MRDQPIPSSRFWIVLSYTSYSFLFELASQSLVNKLLHQLLVHFLDLPLITLQRLAISVRTLIHIPFLPFFRK